jgi:hypothetical protein
LWNGLALIFHRPDVVNGETRRAGYGGTMLRHGKQQTVGDCLPGDVVIYGHRFPGEHVALIVGKRGSTPMVVSHGSEARTAVPPVQLPLGHHADPTVRLKRRKIRGDPEAARFFC